MSMLNKGNLGEREPVAELEMIDDHTYFELGSFYLCQDDPRSVIRGEGKFSNKNGQCKDEYV